MSSSILESEETIINIWIARQWEKSKGYWWRSNPGQVTLTHSHRILLAQLETQAKLPNSPKIMRGRRSKEMRVAKIPEEKATLFWVKSHAFEGVSEEKCLEVPVIQKHESKGNKLKQVESGLTRMSKATFQCKPYRIAGFHATCVQSFSTMIKQLKCSSDMPRNQRQNSSFQSTFWINLRTFYRELCHLMGVYVSYKSYCASLREKNNKQPPKKLIRWAKRGLLIVGLQ